MVEDFFTRYSDHYQTRTLFHKDYFFDFMKKNAKQESSLLDIGGGNGLFASSAIAVLPDLKVTVVDPCVKLMESIDDREIIRVEGELPEQLNVTGPFDFVHVGDVLHHVTGSSVSDCKRLLANCLDSIHPIVRNGGYLLVDELFYESCLRPETSRNLIFWMLQLQNQYHVWIPTKDFVPGLTVCFYTRNELAAALKNAGFEVICRRDFHRGKGIRTSLLLLRDWGVMQFICRQVSV